MAEKKQVVINEPNKKIKFEDSVYLVATILFVLSWIAPSLLGLEEYEYSHKNLFIQSFMEIVGMIDSKYGIDPRNFMHWRTFSWMFFVLAAIVVAIKNLFNARKNTDGIRKVLLRKAIYIIIAAALLFRGILTGAWDGTWLSGPITWILFKLIWIFFGKPHEKDPTTKDFWLLLIFMLGIAAEMWTRAWVAFPVSWIIISAIEIIGLIRMHNNTEDTIYDILYHTFTIILISIGLIWNIWFTSWLALPLVSILSKLINARKSWAPHTP